VDSDKPAESALSGVLVVDKPSGPSSMRVVATVRRRAGGVRTGHAGTLDPLATGVLVLALGKATKIIDRLMGTDKRYETRIDLTAFTETDDREGEREEVEVAEPPDEVTVRAAVATFTGTFLQLPPVFSAVKVGGRRAYKMARKGKAPTMTERSVTVHAIELRHYDWPFADVSIHCAKGFYVRSLARNLGEKLGTGGHCASIRRTAVGPFTLEMATPLDDVPEPVTAAHLITPEQAVAMVT